MSGFIVSTVSLCVWAIILAILIPVIIVSLRISSIVAFHLFSYCEIKITDRYNKEVATIKRDTTIEDPEDMDPDDVSVLG